ncbi:uncharacterized protein B0I36DRAFT_362173 [Microdochium trichocladiopsis]|uniref:Uncharacterized protein n=1 Tax=Microdochium trichocladiopsis TaxID=1682393 RepID=A0A9P8Y9M1_9PEZI|nr:uncharacterized protein B0I36DRAFT_362173 [Microdochium trichocladiopsis]KAH7033513.1 hypothetical protein B0I36DRAFT_362173 [Microdochium trichocladiopsis]
MTIDHCGVYAISSKADAVNAWYAEALKPLGYTLQHSEPGDAGEIVGYGEPGKGMDFWVIAVAEEPNLKLHIAFTADALADEYDGGTQDRAVVDKFHAAAVAAGGKDNGPPGLRKFHPNYYAAFVHDPVGNNIEVVCHKPNKDSAQ